MPAPAQFSKQQYSQSIATDCFLNGLFLLLHWAYFLYKWLITLTITEKQIQHIFKLVNLCVKSVLLGPVKLLTAKMIILEPNQEKFGCGNQRQLFYSAQIIFRHVCFKASMQVVVAVMNQKFVLKNFKSSTLENCFHLTALVQYFR